MRSRCETPSKRAGGTTHRPRSLERCAGVCFASFLLNQTSLTLFLPFFVSAAYLPKHPGCVCCCLARSVCVCVCVCGTVSEIQYICQEFYKAAINPGFVQAG